MSFQKEALDSNKPLGQCVLAKAEITESTTLMAWRGEEESSHMKDR
jgi:hypothetical protein